MAEGYELTRRSVERLAKVVNHVERRLKLLEQRRGNPKSKSPRYKSIIKGSLDDDLANGGTATITLEDASGTPMSPTITKTVQAYLDDSEPPIPSGTKVVAGLDTYEGAWIVIAAECNEATAPLPIVEGGTGGGTVADAQLNLFSADPLPVAYGGTGADNTTDAKTNLGITSNAPSYGHMYEVAGSSGITITTAGTYYGWTTATSGTVSGGNLVTFTNDATADRLTIGTEGGGKYLVSVSVSADTDTSDTLVAAIFKNGTITNFRSQEVAASVGGDVTCTLSITAIITLASTDYLDLRFTGTTNSQVATPIHVNFTIHRLEV